MFGGGGEEAAGGLQLSTLATYRELGFLSHVYGTNFYRFNQPDEEFALF